MDVFPNVLEHFQDSCYLEELSSYDEERGVYTRNSGNGEYTADCIFKNMIALLNNALAGKEFELDTENTESE